MTVDAEIVVLFTTAQPGEVSAPGVMGLSMIEDAYLHCWVSPTGQLEYCSDARSSPLLGESSLEGRMWKRTLGRHWTPDYPEHGGHPSTYADAIRTLAAIPGIQYVWYGVLTDASGCRDVPAVTDDWITSYFGAAPAA